MFRHILVPIDGTKASEKAAKSALKLAHSLGARVTAVHVIPKFHAFTYRAQLMLSYHATLAEDSPAGYKAATRIGAGKLLRVVTRAAEAAGVKCDTLEVDGDRPFAAIVDAATKKRCDLIVMASHGRSGMSAVLLGSETQKVLTHSAVPVLVVR